MMDETALSKDRKRICCEYAWEKEESVFHREVAASRKRLWGQRENWKNKTEDAITYPQLILGEPLHIQQCSFHLSQVGHGKSETWICLMVHGEGKPGSYSSQEAKNPAALTTSNTGLFPPLMVFMGWQEEDLSTPLRCKLRVVFPGELCGQEMLDKHFTCQRWTKVTL